MAEAEPLDAVPETWECPTCTFHNPQKNKHKIERERADAPHLRRHLHKDHAASPLGVAHGRGPRLAPRLPGAWG